MLTTEQKQLAEDLAKELGELTGAIIHALPNNTEEEVQEYFAIIKSGIDKAASVPAGENPIKDISENTVDVLGAIANIIPDSTNPKKQKAKKRFKSAVGVIRNMLHLFGL